MDEYNTGMDPELKRYFSQIINTVSILVLWMLIASTLGLALKLGIIRGGELRLYNIIFYVFCLVTLFFALRYVVKIWKRS
jgi:hypothetical protein